MKAVKKVIHMLAVILAFAMLIVLSPPADMQAYAADTIEVYPIQDVRSHELEEDSSLNLLGIRGNNGDSVFITLKKDDNVLMQNRSYTLEGDEDPCNGIISINSEELGLLNIDIQGMEISVYADRRKMNLLCRAYINTVFAALSDSGDKILMGVSTGDAVVEPPELFYHGDTVYELADSVPNIDNHVLTYRYEPLTDGVYNNCPPVGVANIVPVSPKIQAVEADKIEVLGNFSRKEMKIIFPTDETVTNYRIQYRMAGDKVWQTEWSNGTGTCIIKNIEESSLCEFRIAGYRQRADGRWKRSKWSDISYRYMKAVKIKSIAAGRKSITVRWQKDKWCDGYHIKYCANNNCRTHKYINTSISGTRNIRNRNTTCYTIKHLQKDRKYYVNVCPYKIRRGKTYQGILQ